MAWFSPLLYAAIAWFGVSGLDEALAGADPQLIALNALPYFLVFLAVWLLSQRTLFALAAGTMLLTAFHFAHHAKLHYLLMPLLPDDLLMLPQMLGHLDFFIRYGPSPWLLAGFVAVFAAALVLEPRSLRWRWPLRLATGAVMIVGLVGLWEGWQPWPRIYTSPPLRFELWQPRQSAEACGATAFFVRLAWVSTLSFPAPDAAKFDALRKKLAASEPKPTPAVLPDIVVLQSESFFDPSRLNGLDLGDYAPNLIELSGQAIHGEMRVPTFGGGTTETEFETLTGISLNPLPNVDYPYQSLVSDNTQSLVRGLFGLGYSTIAIHPYHPNFYLRDSVYPKLGFERFLSIADFNDRDRYGYYVSDEALVNRIVAELDAPGDSPRFIFAVSMENHGPWGAKRAETYDEPPAPVSLPGLTPDMAQQLGQYLHHLHRSDAALGRLAQILRERERPTLLLFYGDHLPGLQPIFANVGFRDGKSGPSQPVPFLLLDNHHPHEEALSIRSSELAGLMLDTAGIDLGANFRDLARMVHSPDLNEGERDQFRRELALTVLNAAGQADEQADFRVIAVSPSVLSVPADGQSVPIRLRAMGLKAGAQLYLNDTPLQTHRFGMRLEAAAPTELLQRASAAGAQARLDIRFDDGDRREINTWTLASTGEVPKSGFCPVTAWGPDHTAAGIPSNPQPDGSQGIWIKIPCYPADARILFNGKELDTFYEPGLITALLPRESIQKPGVFDLALRAGPDRVPVGKMQIIPVSGETPSNGFCPVTAWGPDRTVAGTPSNPQPDGSQGIWIKIPCYPADAHVLFDGKELDTFYEPGLITALLPRESIRQPGEFDLSLQAGPNRVLVGKVRVDPSKDAPGTGP